MARLTWLGQPGSPEAWRALGFEVDAATVVVGGVLIRIDEEPAWGFDELLADPAPLGVPTRCIPATEKSSEHPNLVDRIDHVVYGVPDLDAAVAAIGDVLSLEPRRRFHPRGPDGPEMAFFRAGTVLEVVAAGAGPVLWGLALRAPDLDATVAAVRSAGGAVGDPKPSVQGGRIASVPPDHLGTRLAIMEPPR